MRRLLICCLIAALVSVSARAEDSTGCRQFFDVMRARAVAIFKGYQENAQKRVALAGLFNEVMDSQWIARFVAGPQWRLASEQDRADFTDAYRAYLADRYIGGLDDDDMNGMQDIELVEFAPLGSAAYHARTRIVQKDDAPIDIDFRLQEEPPGTCHVRDFSIEGVSLISSQRDQVQTLAQSGGLKGVTQRLLDIIHSKPSS